LTLLILVVILFIVKYNRPKKIVELIIPKLKIANIQLLDFDSKRANLKIDLGIDNALPLAIVIDSIHYSIYIQNQEILKDHYVTSIRFNKNDTSNFSMPVILYYDKLVRLLETLDKKGVDSVIYKIKTVAYTNWGIAKEIVLTSEKYLPLLRIPDVSIIEIKVNDVKFSGAIINIKALVGNRNVFFFGIKDVAYSVSLENQKPFKGTHHNAFKFPAMDSTIVTIPVKVNFRELNKSILEYIRKGGKLKYSITATMKLVSQHSFLKDSKIIFTTNGQLNEIKKVREEIKKEKEGK
jgi:LEA14-like dessication related protein